jgi:hypothetical protein
MPAPAQERHIHCRVNIADAEAPHHCAFVDAAFGDAALRMDCADHQDATPQSLAPLGARFSKVA